MSRIGRKTVAVPKDAKIKLENGVFYAEGPKGKQQVKVPQTITVDIKDNVITVGRSQDLKKDRELHGLIRNLINNCLIGVTKGYKKQLDIIGVGFKAQLKGKVITLLLGYSHDIQYTIPEGVTVTVPQPTSVVIEGPNKASVGQVAAELRDFYRPEPYKGKGVRYTNEVVRRKQGKVVG